MATPGRLIDLIKRGTVSLENVRTVVLDEADEMLNMGFAEDIDQILSNVPDGRGMLLFSATMPQEIAKITRNYMNEPVEITIGRKNEGATNVRHIYYMVHPKDKYLALKRVVDYYPNIYGIVFCRTRKETQEIADNLMKDGYSADSLHGDLSQAQRDHVMNKFRNRNLQLLVATDVAARGLDVDSISHIINYGLPEDNEIYTHRSGRTGRAGKTGTSISWVHLKDKGKIARIEKSINKTFEKRPIPSGDAICEKQLFNFVDKIEKVKVNEAEIERLLPSIFRKLEWLERRISLNGWCRSSSTGLLIITSRPMRFMNLPTLLPARKRVFSPANRRRQKAIGNLREDTPAFSSTWERSMGLTRPS